MKSQIITVILAIIIFFVVVGCGLNDQIELEEIPELSFRNISDLEIGKNYICYGDTLILGSIIYQKEEGKYIKQESTLNSLFDIANELAMQCMQDRKSVV